MICPICQEPAKKINTVSLLSLIDSSTYHCSNCGIYFRYPLPSKEAVHNYYTSRYFRYPDNIEKEMARVQGSFIVRNLEKKEIKPQEIHYLEFGAGRGWVLSFLQKSGFKSVIGLEPDQISTQWSKDNLKVDIRTGTLDEQQIRQVTTDFPKTNMVSLIHVLEHLHNPEEIITSLKKDIGRHFLFLEVPDAEYEGAVIQTDTFPWSSMGQHFWSFSERSLRLILERQGYRIVSLEKDGNPHFWDRSIEDISRWNNYFNCQKIRFDKGNLHPVNIVFTDLKLVIRWSLARIKNLTKPKFSRRDLPVIRILAESQ